MLVSLYDVLAVTSSMLKNSVKFEVLLLNSGYAPKISNSNNAFKDFLAISDTLTMIATLIGSLG